MVADMEVEKVTGIEVHKGADMEVDMVDDIEVDMVADKKKKTNDGFSNYLLFLTLRALLLMM